MLATVAGLTAFDRAARRLGLFIESVGINPVARAPGGRADAGGDALVYLYSSFGAGPAGLMITSNIKSADANAGLLLELDAILAVTLGGGSERRALRWSAA